jgi:hypothetical protein
MPQRAGTGGTLSRAARVPCPLEGRVLHLLASILAVEGSPGPR